MTTGCHRGILSSTLAGRDGPMRRGRAGSRIVTKIIAHLQPCLGFKVKLIAAVMSHL